MSRVRNASARKRRKHEDHANHEAWAIPYGDLITLLLAFFVVMYAMSSVNAGKYRVLSDSLVAAFQGTPRTLQPVQVGEREVGSGADLNTTVVQQATLEEKSQSRLAPLPKEVALLRTAEPTGAVNLPPQAAAAAAALSSLADRIEQSMSDLVHKDMVKIRRNDFWIEVEMRTDILFPSGSARLANSAVSVLEQLGTVLAPFPNPIRVEGHTDNVPIKTALFYSNWELSAARAGSVVRVLSDHGVAAARLAVVGYADQRPLQSNDNPEGRNANRRVVIVILSTELTRQGDPSQPSSTNLKVAPLPNSGPAVEAASQAGGTPAPVSQLARPDEPAEPPAAALLPAASLPIQHNTGTETAP